MKIVGASRSLRHSQKGWVIKASPASPQGYCRFLLWWAMLKNLLDWLTSGTGDELKPPAFYMPPQPLFGVPRSPKWESVRKRFLFEHPSCAACGATALLNVHHVRPFHIFPTLELDTGNLITLCEGPMACHFALGHLGDWRSFCLDVAKDAAERLRKVRNRP